MINSSKEEEDFPLKQEGLSTHREKAKAASTSQWVKLEDPRIVRVSKALGGKDRHSKVYTIRGLRDRRVRLSVPTAIHLYNLQDRLGLDQSSKVIDWLLNVAKNEIDELPPLPISLSNFTLGYPSFASNDKGSPVDVPSTKWSMGKLDVRGLNPTSIEVISSFGCNDGSQNNTSTWKSKSKQVLGEMIIEKENLMNTSEELEEDKQGSNSGENVLPNNLLQRGNQPSFLGLLNTMPFGYQLEPSVDDVNQITRDIHGIDVVPFPSSLSLPNGGTTSHQFLVCPPGGTTQSYFPSHVAGMEMELRETNHYQILSSNSHNSFNPSQHLMRIMTPKFFHSPNSSERHQDQDFPSK